MILWLFLMQLCLLLGSEQVADVNVEEAAVDTVLGDVGKCLIGILAERIMLPADGRHTTRLPFPLAAVTLCLTAKSFAFPVTRILAHMAVANFEAEQAPACSVNQTYTEVSTCLTL